jgi:3-oxoacyl-[acyl-carrier-protein] synthase-3
MRILGTGVYAPGKALSHSEVMELTGLEFDGQRMTEKLGIETRHIAHLRGIDETSADFGEKAARAALENAGVSAVDIDLIVVATDTPEFISPATAMVLQGRLQSEERATFSYDLGASCSSFVAALQNASHALAGDPSIRRALVIGIYNMPAYFRPDDAFGYSIFADGAGAWVLGKDEGGSELLAGHNLTDGTQWNFVGVYSGGTRQPVTSERLESGEYGLQLLQRLPGDRNVKLWPKTVHALLAKAQVDVKDLGHALFTQINRSVIEEVMGILGLPLEKTTCVMDRYGYTGSACIPMAFHHARAEGRVKRGDLVAVVASGAGLAVSSAVFRY